MSFDPAAPVGTLDECFRALWQMLSEAQATPGHPWRTPVLVTRGSREVAGRVVVLRDVSQATRRLEFHTDARSPKRAHLQHARDVEWVFYHPTLQLQLRAQARATVHAGDAVARRTWRRVPPSSYLNYLQPIRPGAPLRTTKTTSDLAGSPDQPSPFFAVVRTQVTRLDLLWLHPAGHRRAVWARPGSRWTGHWVCP